MDIFDRKHYAAVYRSLAEILERDRPDPEEKEFSYRLGDLARRVFVGSRYLPPDELLEEVAELLRSGEPKQLKTMGQRLRDHAQHLDEITER